jgi:inhibitor of KinA
MLSLEFLGDQGVLARFADENEALNWSAAVRGLSVPWVEDIVQAYLTVAVFVTPEVDLTEASQILAGVASLADVPAQGRLRLIPCCYDFQLDLERIAGLRGLSSEEVVNLHSSVEYTVYAIGFCPGFPYLGYLPEPLCGAPRLTSPRLRVEPGSVGLTGRQTGIYTEARPGGWNLVGRTPLCLVDVEAGYFPLRTGDRVKFVPIGAAEYRAREGERLKAGDPGVRVAGRDDRRP